MLRDATAGMTEEQLDAKPIAGKWSTRQVVCHIADFEPVYADRMKRAIAENQPTVFSGDPDVFAAKLAYDGRNLEEELQLIDSVRKHVARILRTLGPDVFQRTCNHSEEGPLTVETLIQRMIGHIPHHIKFIAEKRAAL
jgi:uncharacterized damage-inducible protein DinB